MTRDSRSSNFLEGQQFNLFTVIAYERSQRYRYYWRCRCDCGVEKVVREDALLNGSIKSCHACLMRRRSENRPPNKTCPACGATKPRNKFASDKSTSDHLRVYCRKCSQARAKERRDRYKKRLPEEFPKLEVKKCQKCCIVKPAIEFFRDRSALDGLNKKCRTCASEFGRNYYEKTRESRREHRCLLSRCNRHGLTDVRFNQMLAEQENRCQICRLNFKDSRDTHVDHCHKTGVVRSLLCSACNTGIGHFKENVAVMEAAIIYLKRFST